MTFLKDYTEIIGNKYEQYFVSDDSLSAKASIIIPCYNSEKTLEDCLASVIKQTLKDIEIIVVNDGSNDSTKEIIEAFSKLDKRIIQINQSNKGLSGARNSGFKYVTAKYVTFLDSDDWIDSDYIEKLYNSITKFDCDIAVSGMIRKRPRSQKYRLNYKDEKVFSLLEDKINACNIPACCYVCGKLFKTNLINTSPFKEGVYFEDVIWSPEIIKKSDKLVTVPGTYYYYRVNSSSIVKTKQSKKKQKDSYNAHKYIIKFFKENNLPLSYKYKNITKELHYFFNFLTLKVKDFQGIQGFLLFGFIPVHPKLYVLCKKIFSISDFDCHKMIYLFGIQIRKKYNVKVSDTILKESGVINSNRDKKIILSLTTFPDRINTVSKTIKTLLNQTLKPDKLVLWLAESQFPKKEAELPKELVDLREFGLTIDWCEDIRSYKKLVPALKKYPDDIIITFDDDIYYDNDVVENLYNSYLEYPDCISTNRGHRVDIENNQIKPKKNAEIYWTRYTTPSYKNTIIGCGGVLYPPYSLNKLAVDENKFKNIIPTQDDLWFWAMAVLNKTKIQIVSSYDMQIIPVENTQQYGLCKINNNSKKGVNGKDGFKVIAKHFPEVIEILKGEKNA